MLDPAEAWQVRASAASLLAIADPALTESSLLHQFYTQKDETELYETALTMEQFGSPNLATSLLPALYDPNPYCRKAAAQALGWLPARDSRPVTGLIQVLLDRSQPIAVREEAAESLADTRQKRVIEPLISVLKEPDPRIRFWAVFALGTKRSAQRSDPSQQKAIEALQAMLADNEAPPSNWWSVGKEALAMLAALDPKFEVRLTEAFDRVLNDPNASTEDRR